MQFRRHCINTPNYLNKDIKYIQSLLRFYEAKESGKWPSQCYLFKSCGRKVETAAFDCSINAENTLEVKPFTKSEEECEMKCQEVSINITVFIPYNEIKMYFYRISSPFKFLNFLSSES